MNVEFFIKKLLKTWKLLVQKITKPKFKHRHRRYELISDYIKNRKVLDCGIIQHDVKNVKKKQWMHE